MEEQRLWTKNFIVISIMNFFIMLVTYLLIVTIAPYTVETYGVSTSMAGLVSGIFIIGTLIARIITGSIIETVGSKKILLIGLVVSIISTGLYFGATNISLLLGNRLLHGIGLGITSTATGTIIAQIIPTTRQGEGIGYFSMSTVMATAIGPFVGIMMSQHLDYKMIFALCFALGAVSLVMFLFVSKAKTTTSSVHHVEVEKVRGISRFIEMKAMPISIITLFVALAYSGVLSFISFYAQEVNLVQTSSFFFLVYAIAVLISRPFTGRLLDVKGAKFVIYPALICFAIGLLLLSQVQNGWMLLIAGALIGLGFGNFQSCAQAIALKGVSFNRIGIATSTFYIFLDFGFGFGPYFLGVLIPKIGYSSLYLTLMVVVMASILLFMSLYRKNVATGS